MFARSVTCTLCNYSAQVLQYLGVCDMPFIPPGFENFSLNKNSYCHDGIVPDSELQALVITGGASTIKIPFIKCLLPWDFILLLFLN